MGRIIAHFFRVVQRLLNIVVIVSSKEIDCSLICVSTMHHLEHCRLCIIVRFCFLFWGAVGNRVTLYMHLHFEWFLDSALIVQILHIQFSLVLVMLWSAVIVSLNWCGVSTKKSFCIYQSTTWPGRNIGHIMNHNISIQTKLCMQELFVEL